MDDQKVPNGKANAGPVSAGAGLSRGTEPGTAIDALIEAMPIIASRPFFSSETRFSASCSAVSFFVKPGVSQKFCVGVDGFR